MKALFRCIFLLALTASIYSIASADENYQVTTTELPLVNSVINRTINYQGILKDNAGNPVGDANYNLTFRIYNNSSGGSLLWTSAAIPVLTSDGYFSANLGTVSLPFDTTYYLSVQVQGDAEMSRQAMTMVPYAARSDTANYASVSIDNKWTLTNDVLYTDNNWGLSRGSAGNNLYGMYHSTHINLGEGSNTGASGMDISYCTVGGGYQNNASGQTSTVGGGLMNEASGYGSAIIGGGDNTAIGMYSAISGGVNNTATASYGGVVSGNWNIAGDAAEDTAAFVGGGYDNSATGSHASVSGGKNNIAGGQYCIIGGGRDNSATGSYAAVNGGYLNYAVGNYSAVGGGNSNSALGTYGGVISGYYNVAGDVTLDTGAVVGGGCHNSATSKYATVSGGLQNSASYQYTTVGGGYSNLASGIYSTISGGYGNSTDAQSSSIPGGENDTIADSGDYSLVFGRGVYCNNNYRVVFFDSLYDGSFNINRDSRDGSTFTYPIHVGTNTSNGNGAHLTSAGVWTNGSGSLRATANRQPLSGQELLTKISALSVDAYNPINSTEKHIGPVAEEFVKVFDTGVIRETDGLRDDQSLAAGDVAGVALAGVQELLKIIEAQNKKIEELQHQMSELKNR